MKRLVGGLVCLALFSAGAWGVFAVANRPSPVPPPSEGPSYRPRAGMDSSGFMLAMRQFTPWADPTSLAQIRAAFVGLGASRLGEVDRALQSGQMVRSERVRALMFKASMHMYEGQPAEAYAALADARQSLEAGDGLGRELLYTVVFFQGVAGLRRGENENCLECRGEGACVFPIKPTAVHLKPEGSRLAVKHFTEYLNRFPDDLGARWLLNLAYMTLGEHPGGVPEAYRLAFDAFGREGEIGRFRDVAHAVGVARLNQAGGAIMDDFDNDGRLDIVLSTFDPTQAMAFYRNRGDGTFEDRTKAAGLEDQYGGLNCVQTDYNNDGRLDVFVSRGAWLQTPMRPSLLRNNGDGSFTDVTAAAGLMDPVNSITSTWADYDNDGHADVYIPNETGTNRLYRNRGDGTFEEVAGRAGVLGKSAHGKGANWADFDGDGYVDLFVNYLGSTPQVFRNRRDGTFQDVTAALGVDGPEGCFSCWAFDYDNDGHTDVLTTCYQRSLEDVAAGVVGVAPSGKAGLTRLYRNEGGTRFRDVSAAAGVDKVFATMGSNFGDFDNDGYLDFYLATGEPSLSTLVPNRMFQNVGGQRFAEVTAASRTGHLQKGHGVACGDWDADGNVDLFVETGGAVPGDRYHNVLFQNPGHGNNWLSVKLIGVKTNRAALGARVKVTTEGQSPRTLHRHVSSGSSFGANPLAVHAGLGKATAATVEITWPTSGTTQVFRGVPANGAIEVTEFATGCRALERRPIPVPAE